MNKIKRAYIMRGIPGSGKSTAAIELASLCGTIDERDIFENVIYHSKDGSIFSAIHSTDTFFYNKNGEYIFEPWKLGHFHSLNFKKFKKSLEDNIPIVICDNTNILRSEYKKYLEAAEYYGYFTSLVVMPHPSIEVAVERNTHKVPEEAITKMINKWEGYNGRKG